jgi:hypothetical protein
MLFRALHITRNDGKTETCIVQFSCQYGVHNQVTYNMLVLNQFSVPIICLSGCEECEKNQHPTVLLSELSEIQLVN